MWILGPQSHQNKSSSEIKRPAFGIITANLSYEHVVDGVIGAWGHSCCKVETWKKQTTWWQSGWTVCKGLKRHKSDLIVVRWLHSKFSRDDVVVFNILIIIIIFLISYMWIIINVLKFASSDFLPLLLLQWQFWRFWLFIFAERVLKKFQNLDSDENS